MLSCIEDNEARLSGVVVSEPELSHEVHSEKFYKFFICSKRLSSNEDTLIAENSTEWACYNLAQLMDI